MLPDLVNIILPILGRQKYMYHHTVVIIGSFLSYLPYFNELLLIFFKYCTMLFLAVPNMLNIFSESQAGPYCFLMNIIFFNC